MSKIYVDEIAGIADANTVAIPGHVIQVVQEIKTDTFSMTGATWVDIPDLSITITPSSASSKFLLSASIHCAPTSSSLTTNGYWTNFRFTKDGSPLTMADTAGNRGIAFAGISFGNSIQYEGQMAFFEELNTASTSSAITYKVQTNCPYIADATNGVFINRSHRDTDNALGFDSRFCSTFTIMEIAG